MSATSSQRAQARAYSYAQMGLEQFLTYRKEFTCAAECPAKGYTAAQASACAFCPQCWLVNATAAERPGERQPRHAAHRGGVGDGHVHLGQGVRSRRAGVARRRQGQGHVLHHVDGHGQPEQDRDRVGHHADRVAHRGRVRPVEQDDDERDGRARQLLRHRQERNGRHQRHRRVRCGHERGRHQRAGQRVGERGRKLVHPDGQPAVRHAQDVQPGLGQREARLGGRS